MLFNTGRFNTAVFGASSLSASYSSDALVFYAQNGTYFSLSDGSTMILTDLRLLGPTRDLVGGNVPRGDGQYLQADYFRSYTIEAEGIVKASTAALLDAQLDTIRKNLRFREGYLDVTDANGTVKRFAATMDGYEDLFAGRQRYHVTICPWKARFVCKVPFGKARTYTATELLGLYVSPANQTVINTGTYKAQPVVTFLFTAASSLSALGVTNVTTGEQLDLVSPTATAGDVFILNSEDKTVTKNGAAHDYSGAFVSLDVSTNILRLTATATSFTADVTVSYKPTYL